MLQNNYFLSKIFLSTNIILIFFQIIITAAYWGMTGSRKDLEMISNSLGDTSQLMGSGAADRFVSPTFAAIISIIVILSIAKEFFIKNRLTRIPINILVVIILSVVFAYISQELFAPIINSET